MDGMTTTCPSCLAPQDEGLLCNTCTMRLTADLEAVPALVAELAITASKQAKIGSGGKGGPAHERSPINLGAVQVADDLQNTLTTWARDVGNLGALHGYEQGSRFAAAFLLACINDIRRHPAAAELLDEITDACQQARRAIDRPVERQYLGQCMVPNQADDGRDCEAELYASPGAGNLTCKACGVTHDVLERRESLIDKARGLLCTVKEASSYLGKVGDMHITQQRIAAYIRWRRLDYRPGTETFLLGDLLDVISKDTEKRSA